MPKILFVAAHRLNRSPSQRFRFEQYLDFLQQNGFQYTFSYLISEREDRLFYSQGNYFLKLLILIKSFLIRLWDVIRATNYDIVYVQREAFMTGSSFFEKQFAKRSKLVFDFDDSIWLPNVSGANKNLEFLKDYSKTNRIIKVSHLVIAGNTYLAEYAKKYNENVIVIPTTIDADYHKVENKNFDKKPICIGWTGTMTTIQHFETIIPVLQAIKEKYKDKVCFKLIVNQDYRVESLNLISTRWDADSEIKELQGIDIGIMPLPNDEWAEGKCGFKGLQYMALEIPTIMSPVGVNKEIIKNGVNGLLAESQSEWIEKLSLLIENKELRLELGKVGRKTVEDSYSFNSQKNNYLNVFRSVLNE